MFVCAVYVDSIQESGMSATGWDRYIGILKVSISFQPQNLWSESMSDSLGFLPLKIEIAIYTGKMYRKILPAEIATVFSSGKNLNVCEEIPVLISAGWYLFVCAKFCSWVLRGNHSRTRKQSFRRVRHHGRKEDSGRVWLQKLLAVWTEFSVYVRRCSLSCK